MNKRSNHQPSPTPASSSSSSSSLCARPRPLQRLAWLGMAGVMPLLCGTVLAQEPYVYGGFGVGQSRAKLDAERAINAVLPAGVSAQDISRDERDTAYKAFLGYQMNRNWAIEAGYFQLGRFNLGAQTTPTGAVAGRFDLKGINLDLVGSLPMNESWSLLGRIGTQFNRTRTHFEGSGAAAAATSDPSRRDTNIKLGAGLQYQMGGMALRAEAERYRVRNGLGYHIPVNMVSLSLVFPFGRSPTPAPRVSAVQQAQPVMMAAAPPPAAPMPEVVPVPLPPPAAGIPIPPRRMSFSAESLFSFDEAAIQPAGARALDALAQELKGTDFQLIMVEGHTDRLGSSEYNQTLSQERAEAVKNYLVNTGGIAANKISAVGKSESMPVTRPEDCKGQGKSAALISCLKADRRVEVEVQAEISAQR
ncbi:OmpA family protein [Roseateles sp.]|uniref:OmpA family protein n=1 Tax=Roseateles sp. TaxID=1971397 RepID=UPI003D0A6D0A